MNTISQLRKEIEGYKATIDLDTATIEECDKKIEELTNQRDAYKFICKKICEEYEEEKNNE